MNLVNLTALENSPTIVWVVNNMILPVIIGVVVILIGWLLLDRKREKREEETEKREKLEQEKVKNAKILEIKLKNHFNHLIETVIEKWMIYNKYAKAEYFRYQTPLAVAYYQPHFKSTKDPPLDKSMKEPRLEPSLKYIDQVIEHLETEEYSHIRDAWRESKRITNQLLDININIWESIEKKVTANIPTKFVEGTQGQPTYYILNLTVQTIYREAEYFIRTGTEVKTYKKCPVGNYFEVWTRDLLARSPEESLIDDFTKTIDSIVTDENIIDLLKTRNKERENFDKQFKIFRDGLDKITEDFKLRDINIKGTCSECKSWFQ